MSIDQGMLERTRLVNHGTLDELKIHLAETPLDQDMAQEELNRLLVRSLLAGDKEKFDYLALPQSEVEKKPLADISALYNDNIKKYLTPSDFNIGDPPFTGIRGADIGTRLQASHDILDAIHENQYGADKIQIHMPIMAAYFGHSILMDKLIQEAQENKIWDFNTSITLRPATALALAINLTTGELNDPYDQMARNMIQTANEEIELIKHTTLTPSGKKEVFVDRLLDETEDNSVTGLKISSQFLAISTLFGNGEFDRTQEYLNLMGTRPLSYDDIDGFVRYTPSAIDNAQTSETTDLSEKTSHVNAIRLEILAKVEADIARDMHKENLQKILGLIERYSEMSLDDMPDGHNKQDLQALYLRMIPKTEETHTLRSRISPTPSPSPSPSPPSPSPSPKRFSLDHLGSFVRRVKGSIRGALVSDPEKLKERPPSSSQDSPPF